MAAGTPDAKRALWQVGEQLKVSFTRSSPTTGLVSWTVPSDTTYAGVLIIASSDEINPSNYPTNGQVYEASSDLGAPANLIGSAQVIGAFYNDRTTNSLTATGLTPDEAVFISLHVISNVNTYYTLGVRAYPDSGADDFTFAPDIPKLWSPPDNPDVGFTYFDEKQKLIFVWTGNAWTPTMAHTVLSGDFDPEAVNGQAVGDFFYNTRTRTLKVWTSTEWKDSSLPSTGRPMYLKQDVGTDLRTGPRDEVISNIKKSLGWPVVCVELTEDQLNIAIDNALAEYRSRVDTAYERRYFFMALRPDQQLYYLNDPALGTNKIVDVISINRMNMTWLQSYSQDYIYAQAFLNQFYAPGMGYDLVSIHLINSLSELYGKIFASEIPFNWYEASRQLRVYRNTMVNEKVLLETAVEKNEQELLTSRWTRQWVRGWAMMESLQILAWIRGKYGSIPGPNGGITLNADQLMNQATAMREQLLKAIEDFTAGQNGTDGFGNWTVMIG